MPHINKLLALTCTALWDVRRVWQFDTSFNVTCIVPDNDSQLTLLCRLIKLVEPATTAAQTSSLTAAAGRGYLKLKDDLTAGLLFATTSR